MLVLNLLSGLEAEPIALYRMSFPPQVLKGKKLRGVSFEDCFFADSSLQNTTLEDCKFSNCHFTRLDVWNSTVFRNVSASGAALDCVNMSDESVTIYDPSACRDQLGRLGITFLEPAVETVAPPRRRSPEDATLEFGKVLRVFLRNTRVSEGVIRTKLGRSSNSFISDCIPALLHRGILVEVENRGSGHLRYWKLGRPMEVFNDALENCGGLFSQFLDLATR